MVELYSLRILVLRLAIALSLSYALAVSKSYAMGFVYLVLALSIAFTPKRIGFAIAIPSSIALSMICGLDPWIALYTLSTLYLSSNIGRRRCVYLYALNTLALAHIAVNPIHSVLSGVLGYLYAMHMVFGSEMCREGIEVAFYSIAIAIIVTLSRFLGSALEDLTIFGFTVTVFLIGIAVYEKVQRRSTKEVQRSVELL